MKPHIIPYKLIELLMHSSNLMFIFECFIDCLWFNLGDKSHMIVEFCYSPPCRYTFIDLPSDVFYREISADPPLFWKITLFQIFNRLFHRINRLIFCTVFQILQKDTLFIFFYIELCWSLFYIVSFIKNNMYRFLYNYKPFIVNSICMTR